MPKINQEEYEVLQFLNNTKDWIVRNPDGQLWAVEGEAPWKAPFYETWEENDGQDTTKVDVNSFLFQFIQWEDDEPYSIAELIEEYESEETEVKNIEWLKSAIQQNLDFYNDNDEEWQMAKVRAYAKSLDLINQLDEPETDQHSYKKGFLDGQKDQRQHFEHISKNQDTLSQKWIDEHKYFAKEKIGEDAVVKARDLRNLLVPKREKVEVKVKVKVPPFVADAMEDDTFTDLSTAYIELYSANAEHYYGEDICNWIVANDELFARAWLDGFTVEKEQKYYVLDSEDIPLLERANNQTCKTTTGLSIYEDGRDNSRFELTKQEIKDYDERYWPFAVKAEELEE